MVRLRKNKRATRKNRKRLQRGGQLPKVFHFYNEYHYGDNIMNLKFFYNIAAHLLKSTIKIHYYYNDDYIKDINELMQYVDPKTLILHTLKDKPANAIQLWSGNPIKEVEDYNWEQYYNVFYKNILKQIGLDNIDTSLFQNEPYLLDRYKKLDQKFKDLDILIINGKPQSGQFDDPSGKLDALSIQLSKKYKIAITTPIAGSNIPCTFTQSPKLTMCDIGAISTHAKCIIAIFTGPITACMNSYTKAHVKKWFILTNPPFKFDSIPYIRIPDSNSLDKIVPTI